MTWLHDSGVSLPQLFTTLSALQHALHRRDLAYGLGYYRLLPVALFHSLGSLLSSSYCLQLSSITSILW